MNLRTNRRAALGMGLSSVVIGNAHAVVAGPERVPARFDDPVWNREQAARLQAHTSDGKQIFGRCSGVVHGIRPGEAGRELFGFEVFSTIRVVRRPDGNFDRMSKEVVFYTDLKTGKILEEWDNPYTRERVRVVDIANDPYNWVIRDYVGPPALPGTDSHDMPEPKDKKPFLLHWTDFSADTVVVTEGGHGWYPNQLVPAKWPRESSGPMVQASELFRYFIKRTDLEDGSKDHLTHNGVWIRVTPWLPWMLMGTEGGHILYDGMFCSNETLDHYKPEVIARVRAKYPQYLEAPTKWYGPSISSIEHYALEQKPAPAKR